MPIPRLQLFELEDQAWFPAVVRDLATDYLRFVEHRFRLHLHALPPLSRAIDESGATRVVDLCSGGAGPVPELLRELRAGGADVDFVLTDLYPNLDAFEAAQRDGGGAIGFVAEPVDARDMPPGTEGLRTFFNAFHHFAPKDAASILKSAVESGQPIAEIPERSVLAIVPLLFTPLFVWLATPFIRPMSWRRLLLTYLLPVVPLTCVWDGIVSQLRAYRPEELKALADGAGGSFRWEVGVHQADSVPGRLTYLLGRPAPSED
jgi:hypothetical protein